MRRLNPLIGSIIVDNSLRQGEAVANIETEEGEDMATHSFARTSGISYRRHEPLAGKHPNRARGVLSLGTDRRRCPHPSPLTMRAEAQGC